jgi:hypothetical protein
VFAVLLEAAHRQHGDASGAATLVGEVAVGSRNVTYSACHA